MATPEHIAAVRAAAPTPAPARPADRSRDYNAVMHCDAEGGWLDDAASQLASWLRTKGHDVDTSDSCDLETENASLSIRRLEDGRSRDLRLSMAESSPMGTWTTELLMHDAADGDSWVSISVGNDQGRFVNVPRIARYLMEVLPLRDGAIEFADRQQTFHAADTDRLVELLADERRHGLVFVSGTRDWKDLPFGTFARKVDSWAKEVYGLAQVVVLDPDATLEFERRVGAELCVSPWTIRTYQPGARLEDPEDARRHRILGTLRLARSGDRATRMLLGDIARQQAATRPPDPAVLRLRRRFERSENRRLVEPLTDEGAILIEDAAVVADLVPVAPEPQEPIVGDAARQIELVQRVLGVEEITEESLVGFAKRVAREAVQEQRDRERDAGAKLERRIDDLQAAFERAEDESRDLLEVLTDAQTEAEISRLDVDERDARIRWLQSRLKDAQDYEAAYLEVPAEFYEARPQSFDELLEQIEALDCVVFTGDPAEVARLNQVDTNDAALRTAWDAVLAMADYARARAEGACSQGLAHYLLHTPTGFRGIAPGKFAESETAATMAAHGEERIFPVPTDVSPSGAVAMKAHFKLAKIGMASPRMHVYDAHPKQPRLFIGYVGFHLTIAQTS